MTILLEVCVDSAEGLAAAIEGGAGRIELCSALELGGLTPLPSLMRIAARAPIPVYAMIRPHAGPFIFDATDEKAMSRKRMRVVLSWINAARPIVTAVAAAAVRGLTRRRNRMVSTTTWATCQPRNHA